MKIVHLICPNDNFLRSVETKLLPKCATKYMYIETNIPGDVEQTITRELDNRVRIFRGYNCLFIASTKTIGSVPYLFELFQTLKIVTFITDESDYWDCCYKDSAEFSERYRDNYREFWDDILDDDNMQKEFFNFIECQIKV